MDVTNKYGETPLMQASYWGNVEAVRMLISNGADVNHENKNGVTALMLASAEGHVEVVKLLLQSGANTRINEALDLAQKRGQSEVISVLQKAQKG